MPATGKELQPLVAAIRKNGYKVVKTGGKHHKVLDAKGRQVVDENGPLIISGSPGDHRARDMHVKRLIKAKVLAEDPWKPQKAKENGGKSVLTREDVQAKKRAGMEREQKRREERTRKIRSRLEPLVVTIGGWESKGFVANLGQVAYQIAKTRGLVERWTSLDSAQQNTRQLKMGGTLSDKLAGAWEVVLDDLEAAEKPNERFWDLLREAKGLPPRQDEFLPVRVAERQPEAEDEEGELVEARARDLRWGAGRAFVGTHHADGEPATVERERPVAGPLAEDPVPSLALRAVARMMFGVDDPEQIEDAVEIGEEILRLELERRD